LQCGAKKKIKILVSTGSTAATQLVLLSTLASSLLFGDLLQARYCDLKHKFRLQQPTCRIPPPKILRTLKALAIVALLASNTEPTGSETFRKQTDIVSNIGPYNFGSCFLATKAFQIRAPSMWNFKLLATQTSFIFVNLQFRNKHHLLISSIFSTHTKLVNGLL
jgi:hypothetical protein